LSATTAPVGRDARRASARKPLAAGIAAALVAVVAVVGIPLLDGKSDDHIPAVTPRAQQDLRSPDAKDAADTARDVTALRGAAGTSSLAGTTSVPSAEESALAQERYYASYGRPASSRAPHGTDVSLGLAGALFVIAGAALVTRRAASRQRFVRT
jgi:hypothetical protein